MTTFTKRLIGPKEAQEMLSHNIENNRTVRQTKVKEYTRAMKDGEFIPNNGEVLKIGEDGTLIDGQHRLLAVIDSGCTFVFDIAIVDNYERAFKTLDNGTARNASDYIQGTNKKNVAALAKVAYCAECGNAKLPSVLQGKIEAKELASRVAVQDYGNEHYDELHYYVQLAMRTRKAIGKGSLQAIAAAYWLIGKMGNPAKLDAFVEDVCKDNDSKASRALITTVLSAFAKDGQAPTKMWILATAIQAYEGFLSGRVQRLLSNQDKWVDEYSRRLLVWRASRDEGKE